VHLLARIAGITATMPEQAAAAAAVAVLTKAKRVMET
jgi:hypothetical protein